MHILYAFNTHVKVCINWILFTIWYISLYFIHNFKLQKLVIIQFIDDIVIDLWLTKQITKHKQWIKMKILEHKEQNFRIQNVLLMLLLKPIHRTTKWMELGRSVLFYLIGPWTYSVGWISSWVGLWSESKMSHLEHNFVRTLYGFIVGIL